MFKRIPVLLIMLLQFSFLLATIFENPESLFENLLLAAVILLLAVFYFRHFKAEKSRLKFIDFILVLFTALGAVLTYWLNTKFELGVVLASGITGLLGSLIPFINRRSDIFRELPVAFYCGSFVGMTAPVVAQGYGFIASAGILSGIILICSKNTLHGFGGKLGTIAFGGVAGISLILYLNS